MSDGEMPFRPPANLLDGVESVLKDSTGLNLNQIGEKDIPGTQGTQASN
jgi:hypothetical protein